MIGLGNDCLFPLYIKQDSSKSFDAHIQDSYIDFSNTKQGSKQRLNKRYTYLRVPCNRCINCKARRASEWSLRLEMEAHDWDKACFVTLTYNNESLPYVYVNEFDFIQTREERRIYEVYQPYVPTCVPDDISSFVKRLRKYKGSSEKLKFFGVCEYGTKFGRPHIHVLIFGLDANPITSDMVNRAWNYGGIEHGFVRVDPFYGIGTCKYIAGYIMKKLYSYDEKDPLLWSFRMRETSRQSQHLGENYFMSHLDELGVSFTHPFINYEGGIRAIPRTFHRKLVSNGFLPKMSLDDLVNIQRDGYKKLDEFCKSHNTNLGEYFKNRVVVAKSKEFAKTATRRKTGDI